MKKILILPFLLALLLFGVVLYAGNDSRQMKDPALTKQDLVKTGDFELNPSVLVI